MRESLKLIAEKHLTDSLFGIAFSHASEKISKFLLFIIIPTMALFSWRISFKKKRYFYDNFVFCIEASSFFLFWGFLIFPILFRLFSTIFHVSDQTNQRSCYTYSRPQHFYYLPDICYKKYFFNSDGGIVFCIRFCSLFYSPSLFNTFINSFYITIHLI